MMKKEAFIRATMEAIMAPSDTESEKATELSLELAKGMSIGEVLECQKEVIDMVNQMTMKNETIH